MSHTIISSNIRYDNPNDGKHCWNARKQVLWHIINGHNPDLLGGQEGRRPQLLDFSQGLKNLEMIASHRKWIDERMYPCIYVNSSSVDVLDSGDIWLSKTPEAAGSKLPESPFPRLATWIKGVFKKSRKSFTFVNTHLDHLKDKTRIAQAKILKTEILKLNILKYPLILTGDFNSRPGGPVREVFAPLSLQDPWQGLEESTHHKFTGNNPAGARIDWILFQDFFSDLSISLDKTSKDGIWPSDHFPLIARFK